LIANILYNDYNIIYIGKRICKDKTKTAKTPMVFSQLKVKKNKRALEL